MEITEGIDEKFRSQAAELYWDAFGEKINKSLGPKTRAIEYFESSFRLSQAFMASDGETLIGMAGFDLGKGGIIDDSLSKMFKIYGLGFIWRLFVLTVFDRPRTIQSLYVDGIVVAQNYRGQGIGAQLLESLEAKARAENCRFIGLDVINTNQRALKLYQSKGFKTIKTTKLQFFKQFYPFQSIIYMTKML